MGILGILDRNQIHRSDVKPHIAACLARIRQQLCLERRIDPCMSEVFAWEDIPEAHMKMGRNEHKPGNMAVLVSAATTGLRTFDDALEASRQRR